MRAYKVLAANTTQLISTTDARKFLKVDITDDDDVINSLVKAATESAQEYTNRFFLSTTLEQYGTTFADIRSLFKSPVSEITVVKYYDTDNVQQTLSTSVYQVTPAIEPSTLMLKVDQSYPDVADREDAVLVKYTVGYGTATTDVPYAIIQAVYLTIGHWYQNRQEVVVGRIATEIPMGAKYLLDQYKVQVCR
mgnify:FL=1|jgi:uncharacterized phiE125 gp8 family phage protein|tara:strand:+ start:255 stop:833 length:579 start_codon:yes stop_codon:yes gene_type:complete